MRTRWMLPLLAASALAAIASAPSVRAGDQVWHPTLEKGVEAAAKSGRPLLIVTAWKSGV